MRSIIFISILSFTYAANLEKSYLPPSGAQTSGGSGDFLQTPNLSGSGLQQRPDFKEPLNGNGFSRTSPTGLGRTNFENDAVVIDAPLPNNVYGNANALNELQRAERPQSAYERNAGILRQDGVNNGDTYSYTYETENGIFAEEAGSAVDGVEAQGGFSYTGDDGQVYSIRYTADQNGFVPEGDHLPTPPPVPEEILRALEQNAREEAAGIFDDGSYDARKYGGVDENFNSQHSNRNNVNNYNGFKNQGEAYLPPNNGPTGTNQNAQVGQSFNGLGQNFDSARRRPGFGTNDGYSY